jgi:hypothetical protein
MPKTWTNNGPSDLISRGRFEQSSRRTLFQSTRHRRSLRLRISSDKALQWSALAVDRLEQNAIYEAREILNAVSDIFASISQTTIRRLQSRVAESAAHQICPEVSRDPSESVVRLNRRRTRKVPSSQAQDSRKRRLERVVVPYFQSAGCMSR